MMWALAAALFAPGPVPFGVALPYPNVPFYQPP